jgi:hypothetical protein
MTVTHSPTTRKNLSYQADESLRLLEVNLIRLQEALEDNDPEEASAYVGACFLMVKTLRTQGERVTPDAEDKE